ncbi:MAG: undecaprenyl-diphosphate phosphatase [Alphaproteobacteria bacterium]
MPLFHILILSLVQATTEFLPISSSGHLVLLHEIWNTTQEDLWGQSLIMDLAVHVGTLLAVVVYYRKDLGRMAVAVLNLTLKHKDAPGSEADRRLAFFLVAGSVPVLLAGLALEFWEPQWMRSAYVVAFTLPVFGALLWWVDARMPQGRALSGMGLKDALIIGFAQMLALVPGTSRSGITMTAARQQGFSRIEAARFSFLLSTIATAAAGAMGALRLIESADMALAGEAFMALAVTFFAALAVIHWLMKFLARYTFKVFGIYRIALGFLLSGLIYAGILV